MSWVGSCIEYEECVCILSPSGVVLVCRNAVDYAFQFFFLFPGDFHETFLRSGLDRCLHHRMLLESPVYLFSVGDFDLLNFIPSVSFK